MGSRGVSTLRVALQEDTGVETEGVAVASSNNMMQLLVTEGLTLNASLKTHTLYKSALTRSLRFLKSLYTFLISQQNLYTLATVALGSLSAHCRSGDDETVAGYFREGMGFWKGASSGPGCIDYRFSIHR